MRIPFFIIIFSFIFNLCFTFVAKAEKAEESFALSTNAFLDTGILPVLYTCHGKDISPQLSWANPPPKTQSFALILSDAGAPKGIFYHWVLYNIPNKINKLTEGLQPLPKGMLAGKNSFGKTTYNGPCPPSGTVHTYVFTLYALDNTLTQPAGATAADVLKNMHGHVLQETKLSTVYSAW